MTTIITTPTCDNGITTATCQQLTRNDTVRCYHVYTGYVDGDDIIYDVICVGVDIGIVGRNVRCGVACVGVVVGVGATVSCVLRVCRFVIYVVVIFVVVVVVHTCVIYVVVYCYVSVIVFVIIDVVVYDVVMPDCLRSWCCYCFFCCWRCCCCCLTCVVC